MLSSQKIHCGIIKILKFNFLTQNFFSLWWAGDGKTFSFSLSQSFFSLCNLPQRKVSTQLQTGYNGSQRVTTGPNGLERVPTGPNGFQRVWGGGEERSMTRLLSPQYFNNIKKFYLKNFISINISSLSAIIHHSKIFIKKIYIYSYMFIYLYINIYKNLWLPLQKISLSHTSIYFLYLYLNYYNYY
jgi:hypothetical protein